MILKEKVFELKKKGFSYQAIALLFNVSRARIHQIYSGYKPNKNIKETVLARDNWKCQWGKACKGKFLYPKDLVIHHIDGNDRNNEMKNLITLCKKCHVAFHSGELNSNREYKKYICKRCNKEFTQKGYKKSATYCKKCLREKKKEKLLWAPKYKLNFCKICGKNDSEHYAKGICMRCFSKKRYSDPVYKLIHHRAVKNWVKNNPEKNRKIQLRAIKKYQKSHQYKIAQKNAVRYFKKMYGENWKIKMENESNYLVPADK